MGTARGSSHPDGGGGLSAYWDTQSPPPETPLSSRCGPRDPPGQTLSFPLGVGLENPPPLGEPPRTEFLTHAFENITLP